MVTAEDVAQGHEFVLHLLSIGLEAYVINADPTKPRFKNLFNPDHKWLVDQPDAVYLTATLSTDHAYVIEGKRTDECYLSFTVYTHSRPAGWAENVLSDTAYPYSAVSGRKLSPDPVGGDYRIYVSHTEPAVLQPHEQWLRIPAPVGCTVLMMPQQPSRNQYRITTMGLLTRQHDATTVGCCLRANYQGEPHSAPAEVSIISRHYFERPKSVQMYSGRARADAAVSIRVHDVHADTPRSIYPSIPTDENVAERLDFLSNFLVDHTIIYAPGGRESQKPTHRIPDWYSIVPNTIGPPGLFIGTCDKDDPGTVCGAGAPDVHYAAGPWKLAPDEVRLLVNKAPVLKRFKDISMNSYSNRSQPSIACVCVRA